MGALCNHSRARRQEWNVFSFKGYVPGEHAEHMGELA